MPSVIGLLEERGDLAPYWRFHTAREHERLYPTPSRQEYDLTA
ncbi:hypothetical protein [Streptomyces sp. GESEQ-35]|nr:hypothetical protein [Streptomyces sp. GESEQ-35]